MALQTGIFNVYHFAKRETRLFARGWRRGFLAWVVALMTKIALEVHYLFRIRRLQMSPMKRLLLALIRIERLVPSNRLAGLKPRLRLRQHFFIHDLVVTLQAIMILSRKNGWLEVYWIPAA